MDTVRDIPKRSQQDLSTPKFVGFGGFFWSVVVVTYRKFIDLRNSNFFEVDLFLVDVFDDVDLLDELFLAFFALPFNMMSFYSYEDLRFCFVVQTKINYFFFFVVEDHIAIKSIV